MSTTTRTAINLEPRIAAVGREILERAAHHRRRLVPWSGPDTLLMRRLMADPRLRVAVLRFVDVLPVLDDDRELVRHVQEYFDDGLIDELLPHLGAVATWSLRHAHAGLIAAAVRAMVERLARRFIAGHDVDGVAVALRKLRAHGMGFSLDVLGEATVSERESAEYQSRYRHLLEQLPRRAATWPANALLDGATSGGPRVNMSVKITSLYSQLNPVDFGAGIEAVKHRLRPLLQLARAQHAHVTLDMEQFDVQALTIELFKQLLTEPALRDWPNVGIAIQAYLRSAEDDIAGMIDWAKRRGTPVRIRLVRGAYWDYETTIARQRGWPVPVWTDKADTDRCYEACAARLIDAAPHVEPAIATHNVRSQALAIARAEAKGLSAGDYELQMLYGMADPVKQALVDMGLRLRVYVPCGELIPGMAYFVRRLLENTASQSFLRLAMEQDESPDTLLAAPKSHPAPAAPRDVGFVNEPLHRFTDAAERDRFAAAIQTVEQQLGGAYPLLIGGKPRETDDMLESINPAQPGQIVGHAASASERDAGDAIAAACAAFDDWASRPARDRADLLRRAAAIMRRRRDELSAWEIFEAGKPWTEADGDVVEAIDFMEYYAHQSLRLAEGVNLDVPGQTNRYRYIPRGPSAVIAPWNFPLAIVTGMTAAAIVMGNTVVLKPAPQAPVVAAKFVDILREAGLPDGVVNFLPGSDEAGEALVVDPRIHLIAFTGSLAAGCRINALGAEVRHGQHHLKRVIAELGGKNAIIIDRSADMDQAVVATIASAFGYAGQKCSAASRAIVVGGVYDTFVERLLEATKSIRVGPPRDPATLIGPVIDFEAQQRINRTIDQSQQPALRIDVSQLGDGCYVGPTVFVNVDPDSPLAQNEIFGPVLAVLRADDIEHAIRIANHSPYALTGGIFSRTPAHIDLAARRAAAGNFYINQKITGAIVSRQPFGGYKLSGIGSKAGGPDYLLQFVNPRTVTENTLRRGFSPETMQ